MTTFALTFGSRFRVEPHPTFPEGHPDGWVEVEAADPAEATEIGYRLFGNAWASVYPIDRLERFFFPRGCLGRLIDGELVPTSAAADRRQKGSDDGGHD